jgi:hypothetical protein
LFSELLAATVKTPKDIGQEMTMQIIDEEDEEDEEDELLDEDEEEVKNLLSILSRALMSQAWNL